MRVLQVAGSSAVLAIGAATLAVSKLLLITCIALRLLYEVYIFPQGTRDHDGYVRSRFLHVQPTILRIYYAAPLLGPSLGPFLGGPVTSAWNWGATFPLLTIIGRSGPHSSFFPGCLPVGTQLDIPIC